MRGPKAQREYEMVYHAFSRARAGHYSEEMVFLTRDKPIRHIILGAFVYGNQCQPRAKSSGEHPRKRSSTHLNHIPISPQHLDTYHCRTHHTKVSSTISTPICNPHSCLDPRVLNGVSTNSSAKNCNLTSRPHRRTSVFHKPSPCKLKSLRTNIHNHDSSRPKCTRNSSTDNRNCPSADDNEQATPSRR